MVGFAGIGPPRVHTHFVEGSEIFPVYVAGLRIEHVIRLHTAFHGPRLERIERPYLLQFFILRRPWTEVSPYRNHQAGIVGMQVSRHLLRSFDAWLHVCCDKQRPVIAGRVVIRQIAKPTLVSHLVDIMRIHEPHGIPVGVAAPVLPVLNHAVDRYFQSAVLVQHVANLVTALVSLPTLEVTHCPERKHRCLSRERAHLRHHTVLGAVLIHEIIILHHSHLRRERRPVVIVVEI